MKKAHINVQISGIKDSLVHLEATKHIDQQNYSLLVE